MSTTKIVDTRHCRIESQNNYVFAEEQNLTLENSKLIDPVDSFKGRSNILAEISNVFDSPKYRMVVIHGAPGIGKTETARYFAFNNKATFEGNVLWIFAETEENIQKSFAQLVRKSHSTQNYSTQIYNKFKSAPCLIIFDNAENMRSIKEYLPSRHLHPNIKVIITSQYAAWNTPSLYKIHLQALDIQDAVDIIQYIIPDDKFVEHVGIWEDLVNFLECIPLCVQIVSALLLVEFTKFRLREDFDVEKFINDLKEETLHFESKCFPDSVQMHYNKTVMSSIGFALDRLKESNHKLPLDVLYFIAYLDADHIYVDLLLQVPSIEKCYYILEEAINILINYSLIRVKQNSLSIKIHRTVQLVLRQYDFEREEGSMFKTVLYTSLTNKRKISTRNSSSIFRYAQKNEYKNICIEFYKEHEKDQGVRFLIELAYEHCYIPIEEILEYCKTKYSRFVFLSKFQYLLGMMLEAALKKVNDNFSTIELLIKYDAKLPSLSKDISFDYLSKWKSVELFELLLLSNAPEYFINSTLATRETIFHLLIKFSNETNIINTINCLNYLIENNGFIHSVDIKGNNVLHTACFSLNPSFELIKHLIEKCDCEYMVNMQNKYGHTPISILYQNKLTLLKINDIKILTFMFNKCDKNFEVTDTQNWNLFFNLFENRSYDEIKFILEKFDNNNFINIQEIYGDIGLNYIIENSKIEEQEKLELIQLFIDMSMSYADTLLRND